MTRFSHGDLNILNVNFSTIAVENSNYQKFVEDFSTVRQKSPYFTGFALIDTVSHRLLKTVQAESSFSKFESFVENFKRFLSRNFRASKSAHLLKTRKNLPLVKNAKILQK